MVNNYQTLESIYHLSIIRGREDSGRRYENMVKVDTCWKGRIVRDTEINPSQ